MVMRQVTRVAGLPVGSLAVSDVAGLLQEGQFAAGDVAAVDRHPELLRREDRVHVRNVLTHTHTHT